MSLRTYLQGRLQEAQAFDSEGQPGRERDEVGNHARLKAQESSRIVAKRKGLEIRAAQQFSQLAAAKRDRLAARRRALRKENAKRAGCAALEIPNDTRSNGGNGL